MKIIATKKLDKFTNFISAIKKCWKLGLQVL
jgi:hypothetical protein